MGVSYNKQKNKYIARKQINGKREFIGYYDTIGEAVAGYDTWLEINHPLLAEQRKATRTLITVDELALEEPKFSFSKLFRRLTFRR